MSKIIKVNVPKEPIPSENNWFEKYEKINDAYFTLENSGRNKAEAPPYSEIYGNDLDMVDIEGKYGMDKYWKVAGYTLNPPFKAGYPSVAIMFECQTDFIMVWWHYSLD